MEEIYYILIIAVVQGITEFLPISSSAHLLLAPQLFSQNIELSLFFIVTLHTATLLALLVYFASDVRHLIKQSFSHNTNNCWKEIALLLVAVMPSVFIGLLFYSTIETITKADTIAYFLLVTSIFFILVEIYRQHTIYCDTTLRAPLPPSLPVQRKKTNTPIESSLLQKKSEEKVITVGDAFAIGVSQAFGLLPGVSRSGITIATGCLIGLTRTQATRFSFLLAIPTIFGALLLGIVTVAHTSNAESIYVSIPLLIIGFVVTFLIALAVIHLFLTFVERVGLLPFAIYQLLLVGAIFIFI